MPNSNSFLDEGKVWDPSGKGTKPDPLRGCDESHDRGDTIGPKKGRGKKMKY